MPNNICPQCNSSKLKMKESEFFEFTCLDCGNTFYESKVREGGFYKTPPNIDDKIIELLKNNQIINAIKLYKETFSCDLRSAKDYIDKLRNKSI